MKFQLLTKTKMLKNKDISCFQTLEVVFIMLINDKMPTNVGILTFYGHDKFHTQQSMNCLITFGPGLCKLQIFNLHFGPMLISSIVNC